MIAIETDLSGKVLHECDDRIYGEVFAFSSPFNDLTDVWACKLDNLDSERL